MCVQIADNFSPPNGQIKAHQKVSFEAAKSSDQADREIGAMEDSLLFVDDVTEHGRGLNLR